ncbi:zinc finger protein 423-like [Phymastichus coffea]|uniref:zinc finger protein 423-like n=1 Tax=Phymastichus coffea TaxID=108790 RepID=UPI00273CF23E|nr:zinc finger protein 423-like [Phymastichus coffea]
MLTLTESEGRRHAPGAKRQKTIKKRAKSQKKAMLAVEKEVEEKETSMKEELQIHELMPVQYKPEEHENQLATAEVTFEQATVSEQDCHSMASISCMDGVSNSNKFVIITLLEPEAQGITSDELLHTEEIVAEDDKNKNTKLQKKVIFLHKLEPEATTTIETTTAPEPTNLIEIKDNSKEFDGQLMTINFSDFSSMDGKEQKDISCWIKKFSALQLLYTESGKPYVKCPSCTAMFFKVSSFEKHVSIHLRKEEEQLICKFCKYNNEDPNQIFNHLNLHQDQCEVCNMNLTRKNSFKKHWEFSEMQMTFTAKRDRWGRYVCVYCKLGFDLCHQLQKHWFKHFCNSSKTSQCNNCGALFDNDEALQNHVCLKCPVCPKILDSVHRLRSHCRYEKHYVYCQICTYEFILSVDLDKHMELHKKVYNPHKDYAHCLESEDGSSFQCEICGKIYHTMSCLVLHINDDHKIQDTSRNIGDNDNELARITLPEVKDGASYDIITTLSKEDLKCGVDFERACEEVLEVQTVERTDEKSVDSENIEGDNQCQPVALCWNRYSITEQSAVSKET